MSGKMTPIAEVIDSSLPAVWRAEAVARRRISAIDPVADTLEYCARALEDRDRTRADELLTYQEAARESGYHADTLGHLVREGKIPNATRKGAPRIRRGDLPRKPGKPQASAYDPSADALSLIAKRGA